MLNRFRTTATSVAACLVCLSIHGCHGPASNDGSRLVSNHAVTETQVTGGSRKDVFDSVPESLRARLVERLNSLVRFQQTLQWDKLYELLYDTHGLGKEEYIKEQRAYDRTRSLGPFDFSPIEVTFISAQDYWLISGCGLWRVKGRDKYLWTSIYAKSQNGDWYFTEAGLVVEESSNDPDPCAGRATLLRKPGGTRVETGHGKSL